MDGYFFATWKSFINPEPHAEGDVADVFAFFSWNRDLNDTSIYLFSLFVLSLIHSVCENKERLSFANMTHLLRWISNILIPKEI